jgi:hypothetical protein
LPPQARREASARCFKAAQKEFIQAAGIANFDPEGAGS